MAIACLSIIQNGSCVELSIPFAEVGAPAAATDAAVATSAAADATAAVDAATAAADAAADAASTAATATTSDAAVANAASSTNTTNNTAKPQKYTLHVCDEKGLLHAHLQPTKKENGQATFNLDFGYGGNLSSFYSGKIEFYLNNEVITATKEQVKNLTFTADQYCNKFKIKEDGQLICKIKMAWGKWDKSKDRRERNEKHFYHLFRHILPINNKKVIFESFSKRTFSDNPKAIYEELAARNAGYECIWSLVNTKTDVGSGGKTVRFESLKYWYHLATAKYIVSNFNQYRLRKRKGQIVINTMHGVPLKHMGLSATKRDVTKEKMKRTFDSWDYFVTPCDYMSNILTGPHYGFKGKFICAGYPRNDVVIAGGKDEDMRQKVRSQLGVPKDKKIILWAPTWRTKKSFDIKLDLETMRKALGKDYVLVLRAHYLESTYVPKSTYNDFVLNGHNYENVSEMMFAADVLITDYSSIMFDYSLLKRPMIFFVWDYDYYMNEKRGMYFDLRAEFPKLIAQTTQEVVDKIQNTQAIEPDVVRFHNKFNQYDKGDAASKVCDAIWPDSKSGAKA